MNAVLKPIAAQGPHHPARERRGSRGLVRALQDAARGAARGPRPHRHQAWLRAGRMRRLRRAGRRRAAAVLPEARARVRRQRDRDHRRAGQRAPNCIRCRRRFPTTAARSAAIAHRAS